MKRLLKIIKNPLFWIFLLALLLRTYKLGDFPYGFHVDEAKVAWNSLSILKTGHDDQGGFLSLYYNSFGDYRPTGILYFTIPSVYIFGRNEFATRFPVALFGALTVFPIYLLANILNITVKKKRSSLNIGYISAFLLSISPWAIDLSRATNEVVISTFFALLSIYFFIKLIKTRKINQFIFFIISITISYLLYHAVRFLALPIIIGTFIFYKKEMKTKFTRKIGWLCIIATCLLTLFFSTTKEGLARFDQISIFKDVDTTYQIQRIKDENKSKSVLSLVFDSKVVIYTKRFIDSYSQYFSGDFLIGTGGRPFRFATPGFGLLTYIDMVFVIFGLIQIIQGKKSYLPLVLLFIAPLPAAITAEDVPNLSRAFLMLPFLILIAGIGMETIFTWSAKHKKKIGTFIFILLMFNFAYFLYMYFNHSVSHRPFLKNYSGDSPTYRNVGTKELVLKLDTLKTKYDKIIITNFPDSPYPWYAFFTNKDPKVFNETYSTKTNERVYNNIIFSENKCPSTDSLIKYSKKDILIIDSWECGFASSIADGYPLKIVGTINRPDGTMVYTLLERDWAKPLYVNGIYY